MQQARRVLSCVQPAKKGKTLQGVACSARLTKDAVDSELSNLSEADDPENQQLTAEIQCTSRLIGLFLQQVNAWETLEVNLPYIPK